MKIPRAEPDLSLPGIPNLVDQGAIARAGVPGQQISQLGREMMDVADKMQRERDNVDVIRRLAAFSDVERDYLSSEYEQKGENARDSVKRGSDFYRKTLEQHTQGLNDQARAKFEALALSRRDTGIDSLSRHTLQQEEILRKQTEDLALRTAVQDVVANRTSDERVDGTPDKPGIKQQLAISIMALRKGQNAQPAIMAAEAALNEARIESLIDDDPERAMALVQRYRNTLDPGKVVGWEANLKRRVDDNREEGAYQALLKQFPNKPQEAMLWLNQPKNVEAMRLDPKQGAQIQSRFHRMWSIAKTVDDDAHKYDDQRTQKAMDDHFSSMSETGTPLPGIYSQVAALKNPVLREEFNQRDQAAKVAFRAAQDGKLLPPSGQQAILNSMKPKGGESDYKSRAMAYHTVASYFDNMNKAVDRDPAAQAQAIPGVRTPDDILGVQTKWGVAPENQRILSNDQASKLVAKIQAAPAEQRADTVAQLQQSYGPDKFPIVWKDLVQHGKLPAESIVLGTMNDPSQAAIRVKAADAIKLGKKELDQMVPDQAVRKKVRDEVMSELEDWRKTVIVGGTSAARVKQMNDMADAVELTALYLVGQGKSPSDAAEEAAKGMINTRYNYEDTYRVPKVWDKDKVAQLASDRIAGLENFAFVPHGATRLRESVAQQQKVKEDYLNAVRKGGKWVTNENESGLILLDPTGLPVIDATGKRYGFTFKEAQTIIRDKSGKSLESFRTMP